MSSSSNRDSLIATAVVAAAAGAAGAALTYTAMKVNGKKNERNVPANDPTEGRGRKPSLIIGDNRIVTDTRSDSGILFPHNHEEKMRRRVAARVSVEEENMTPRQSVTVRVPATSANVGPGCKSNICIYVLVSKFKLVWILSNRTFLFLPIIKTIVLVWL
jgi:homoserine kinase